MGLGNFFRGYDLVIFGVERHAIDPSAEAPGHLLREETHRLWKISIDHTVQRLERDGQILPGVRLDEERAIYVVKSSGNPKVDVTLRYTSDALKIFPYLNTNIK